MKMIEEYNLNGKKVFMEQTFLILNKEKQNQVNELLKNQKGLYRCDEEDLSIYSSGNRDYIVIDERTAGIDVLVSIKNVSKEIKEGLEKIFKN